MEYCLPDFKGIKRTCLYLGLLFSIMFGLFFWTTQINGYHEIETNKLEPFQYMQKYKSLLLNTNKSNILNKLNKLNNSPQTMPPISLNKNNNLPKQDWWNIDTSFTNCEQKLLGWKQNRDKLTTFNSNDKNIICENNNLSNDLRHAHIECYDKQWRGTHICILKNIYGYITNSKDLKFKAFCKQNVNKQKQNYIEKIKQQFKSKNPENTNFPLYLDIISDANNMQLQQLKINNIFYKNDNNDIYYYDNSHQCEWHKKNDNEHIGNPWHCFGHIEYWFGIAYMRNITMDKYNITVIQSQFNDNKFGPKEAIYHFYDAFFQNVINKNVLNKLYTIYNGELFYIRELIIDERIARDWGMSVIWQHQIKNTFNKQCSDNKINRRSPIFYAMRKQMMNYYERNNKYINYDWVAEILAINDANKWIIHGDLNNLKGKKLVFIGTRYVNNVCRYRCIANGIELKDSFLELFNLINDEFVVIYGNPGVVSFYGQYNLFKNTHIFIGVHGAVFLMASLFMPPWSLKFEITMPYKTGQSKQMTSEDIIAFFDDKNQESYGNYFCKMCITKAGKHPTKINTNVVIDAFKKKMLCFIYKLCDKNDNVNDIGPVNEVVITNDIPFTECEQKYLGWNRNSFGDLSFGAKNRYIICENENYENDIRHMDMKCWHVHNNKGKNYVCIVNNVYGYADKGSEGRIYFKGFCKHEINGISKGVINEIKQSYNGRDPELVKYPLNFEIINDEINENKIIFDNIKYKNDNNDIWYYDNCHQCESHKGNDKQHIGNPWHCFGHIEYYYHIAHRLNITINTYNTTVIMSQFNDYQFGPNIPIYHFFTPFYRNIINKPMIETLNNGLNDSNNMFYIKQMIIDHRNAKGWGYGTIWKSNNVLAFDNDNICTNKQLRRSPVMLQMKSDMISFYNSNKYYSNYNWIHEIQNMNDENKWQINGNINEINNNKKIILIATRYMNGICRYRCIANGNELKNKLTQLFNNDKYIFLYGNPGSLSFRGQYHLFKNIDVFIGVHGAVFLMASMFMELNTFKFEILMGDNKQNAPNSFGVVSMFNGRQFYDNYYCNDCKHRRTQKPSNINVNEVSKKIMTSLQKIYHTS